VIDAGVAVVAGGTVVAGSVITGEVGTGGVTGVLEVRMFPSMSPATHLVDVMHDTSHRTLLPSMSDVVQVGAALPASEEVSA
jgi:hypothetical protein